MLLTVEWEVFALLIISVRIKSIRTESGIEHASEEFSTTLAAAKDQLFRYPHTCDLATLRRMNESGIVGYGEREIK